MNKMTAILVLAAFPALAWGSPETIEMKNRVMFPHWTHMAATGTCSKCHEKKIGKIRTFHGKAQGDANCQGCHRAMGKGPVICSGCHKWGG